MNSNINELKKMISESNKIVFFGGAGVSTESGIPDFRGVNGLYKEKFKFPPEKMLSRTFLYHQPKDFFAFYKDKLDVRNYEPNITHYKLAELEQKGKLLGIITQNIDGLHQKAGSKKVLELHGSIQRNYCVKCKSKYPVDYIFNSEQSLPFCDCGGYVRPDIVLYEEQLDKTIWRESMELIRSADMLIIAGTSLTVQPACQLVSEFLGKYLVIINNSDTEYDNLADLTIKESLGTIFNKI